MRLITTLVTVWALGCAHHVPASKTFNADRAYLESVLWDDAQGDPQLIIVLMGQYSATNQQRAGVRYFERLLDKNSGRLAADIEAIYLSVLATLKCQMADQIPLLSRIGWVKGAIAQFELANQKSKLYIVRWLRDIVYAQLPDRFEKRAIAEKELAWLWQYRRRAPVVGLDRELLFQMAALEKRRGRLAKAKALLKKSGYRSFKREMAITTSFTINKKRGFAFTEKRLREVIPGRLYQASGYEFTEYYFIVSKNGRALFAVDAGTRDDSAKRVYTDLKKAFTGLPPLKAVFITHTHWDHIGGHRFFRDLPSKPTFYANALWKEQIHHQAGAAGGNLAYWFGSTFDKRAMRTFKPHVEIAKRQRFELDGTVVELIPIPGGETKDGMLIHLPQKRIVFTGDMIMPYIGAPVVSEGSVDGLIQAMDILQSLKPKRLFHGHDGINRVFRQDMTLVGLAPALRWLKAQTLRLIDRRVSRARIHHLNLIPKAIIKRNPKLGFAYMIIRENVINRVFDDRVGYWQADMTGVDYLSKRELGSLFASYLKMDVDDVAKLLKKTLVAGDYELARRLFSWVKPHFPKDAKLAELGRHIYLGLAKKTQQFKAFKFIWFAQEGGIEVPELERPPRIMRANDKQRPQSKLAETR
jgi:glyoxylase-like metal-dependent hydrolase (beta-lactamase superfamily II)